MDAVQVAGSSVERRRSVSLCKGYGQNAARWDPRDRQVLVYAWAIQQRLEQIEEHLDELTKTLISDFPEEVSRDNLRDKREEAPIELRAP